MLLLLLLKFGKFASKKGGLPLSLVPFVAFSLSPLCFLSLQLVSFLLPSLSFKLLLSFSAPILKSFRLKEIKEAEAEHAGSNERNDSECGHGRHICSVGQVGLRALASEKFKKLKSFNE